MAQKAWGISMGMKLQVFAVVRLDRDISVLEDAITVKEILVSEKEAEAEVARLNNINGDKNVHYFWQSTRYFPEGR